MVGLNLTPFLILIKYIVYAELAMSCFLIIMIFYLRWQNKRKRVKEKKMFQTMNNIFMRLLETEGVFDVDMIPLECRDPEILLSEIEAFSDKFSGNYWQMIRKQLIEKYIITEARGKCHSKNWIERNFAARCFALLPLTEDEACIILLLKDPVPLVRLTVIPCILMLNTPNMLQTLFTVMGTEAEKSRYAYRDVILRSDVTTFNWIKEQLKTENDNNLRNIYMEILSTKFGSK